MKEAKKWKRISIEEGTYNRLLKLADRRKESFSQLVEVVLSNFLNK